MLQPIHACIRHLGRMLFKVTACHHDNADMHDNADLSTSQVITLFSLRTSTERSMTLSALKEDPKYGR